MPGPQPHRRKKEIEALDHGDDPLIDHKGRSRPLYKRRTKRPQRTAAAQWRPGAFSKLLMGTFPGVRLMVLESVPGGLPYAIVGTLALTAALLLATRSSITFETLRTLAIKQHWFLIHYTALVVSVFVYELARLGSSLEERTDNPKAARAAAALLLPAGLIAIMGPRLIPLHPPLVEATWLAAMVILLGALPAAVRCLFDFGGLFATPRAKMIAGVAAAALLGVSLATVLGIDDARRAIASAAANAGFEILPRILS